MTRLLFCRIMDTSVAYVVFFRQMTNATGRLALSGLQKCTAAIKMLSYHLDSDGKYLHANQQEDTRYYFY